MGHLIGGAGGGRWGGRGEEGGGSYTERQTDKHTTVRTYRMNMAPGVICKPGIFSTFF